MMLYLAIFGFYYSTRFAARSLVEIGSTILLLLNGG